MFTDKKTLDMRRYALPDAEDADLGKRPEARHG